MRARPTVLAAAALVVIGAGHAPADEALARRSGCLECHAVDRKVVGPAYRDVAERYKARPGARAALIQTVRKGGKGNWTDVTGGVRMPPHSGLLAPSEIERLVDWVLSRR